MSSFEKSTSYRFLLYRFNAFINVGSERNKRRRGSPLYEAYVISETLGPR